MAAAEPRSKASDRMPKIIAKRVLRTGRRQYQSATSVALVRFRTQVGPVRFGFTRDGEALETPDGDRESEPPPVAGIHEPWRVVPRPRSLWHDVETVAQEKLSGSIARNFCMISNSSMAVDDEAVHVLIRGANVLDRE